MMVTVPAGIAPGMTFSVQTPSGVMQVTCPTGVSSGGVIGVNVPSVQVAAAPVVQQTPDAVTFLSVGEYDEVWNDRGSGAKEDVSVWKARVPPGCHSLGMTARKGGYRHSRQPPPTPTLVIRAGSPHVAPPVRYSLSWAQERGQRRFWCWHPIAPAGFASLGDVGTLSPNPPPLDAVACVAISCLARAGQPLGAQIWNDRGGGAPKDGAFYEQPGGTGLFCCTDDGTHARPTGNYYVPMAIAAGPTASMTAAVQTVVSSTLPAATIITIDDRRVLHFRAFSCSCSIARCCCSEKCAPDRHFNAGVAQPVCTQPAWTEERWRRFATGMSAHVGSYQMESAPGMWYHVLHLLLLLIAALLFLGMDLVVSMDNLLVVGVVGLGVPAALYCPFFMWYQARKRENRRVDKQIEALCREHSDAYVNLLYKVHTWSETTTHESNTTDSDGNPTTQTTTSTTWFISRKLHVQPISGPVVEV